MNITAIRSDKIYEKMVFSNPNEREDIYRHELMEPFALKWKCIGIPLKSEQPGGYDIISASNANGWYHPTQITTDLLPAIKAISDDTFWKNCESSIQTTLNGFEQCGISLPTHNYIFTVLLSDENNPVSKMTGDYCGDGGIPGYIIGTIIPNPTSLKMLPVALAHETNHNVRWQFMQWIPGQITLADMIISEGLAENHAAFLYGEDKIGMWVKNTKDETLNNVIKPIIKKNLFENDFNKLSVYLYGDEIMKLRGIKGEGIPYCAGYACGYALIKFYLEKTGKSIYEATITSTSDILKETKEFWE